MERILSKDEIAELLSAVKHGTVETGGDSFLPDEEDKPALHCDLFGNTGVGRWKITNLDLIFDSIGRNYGITLTNRLQRPVSVKHDGSDSMEFDRFLQTLPPHCSIGILNLDPFKSGGLAVFDSGLSFLLLELLLGGSVDKVVPLERPVTTIEGNLIRFLMEALCPDLQKAFDSVEHLKPSLLGVETNPRLVNIVPPEAGVLAVRFTLNLEGLTGGMSLVIPHASLEPLREKLRESTLSVELLHNEDWPIFFGAGMMEMQAEVSARIGEVPLNVRDILNFQVGDVIELGSAPNAPLQVLVEGKPKFSAVAGIRNGNKAIRISGRIERSQ